MTRHEICPVSELPPGERMIVEIDSLSIGVFNIDGDFHALNNACPHQLAPLCMGNVTGTVTSTEVGTYNWEREGQIIQCPWHNWEFDIKTGESVFNPHKIRTRTYDVEIEQSCMGCTSTAEKCSTELKGEEPPVPTYEVEIHDEMVVLYL